MASFGDLLREERRKAGITQRELAAKAGLDFSYISKLENGRIPPPAADTVIAICEILKIQAEKLLAASGKLPAGVQSGLGTSPGAQSFLQNANKMNLTEAEWKELNSSLRRLRND